MLGRFAAWFITGPLGHLAAGVTDWAVVLRKVLWARLLRRPVRW